MGEHMQTSQLAKWKTSVQFCGIYLLLWFLIAKSCDNWSARDLVKFFSVVHLTEIIMYGVVGFTSVTGFTYIITYRALLWRMVATRVKGHS